MFGLRPLFFAFLKTACPPLKDAKVNLTRGPSMSSDPSPYPSPRPHNTPFSHINPRPREHGGPPPWWLFNHTPSPTQYPLNHRPRGSTGVLYYGGCGRCATAATCGLTWRTASRSQVCNTVTLSTQSHDAKSSVISECAQAQEYGGSLSACTVHCLTYAALRCC